MVKVSAYLICPDGVNSADFALLAQYWLAEDCGDCNGADLTGDSKVDIEDLQVLAGNWLI